MNHHKTNSVLETGRLSRRGEAGMALIVVLLLLLLVTAIGLGMVFMSNTESSINSNYRDSQSAFFAMRAGLEEVRDRMRSDAPGAWVIAPPTTWPGTPNSILYIINQTSAADPVDPTNAGNKYFDDEFCHENFGLLLVNPGTGIPCAVGPPAGSVTTVASIAPHSNDGTGAALKYKWVRVTMKQNRTFGTLVDAGQPAATQICYQSASAQEIPLTLVPLAPVGGWASCTAAFAAGVDASPVYVVTALAITPNGSRRMGQYEMGSLNIQTPPVALGMDGPGATFNPAASSNNYFINGTDTGAAGYTASGGTGACTPSGLNLPAITTGDQAGITNMFGNPPGTGGTIPVARQGGYTGGGIGPPSVSNGGGVGGAFNGEWSTPADLDNLVNSIASRANTTYPPSGQTCSVNGAGGSPCTPTANQVGSVSPWNPQITYVNGDFDMGNASGAGILVVTGTLSFNGNANFNGLILVVGQGNMQESGGGNGGFNGSVFLAKTKSSTSPYSELATLGSPTIGWNGGGNSFIQYNSCWANWGNQVRYTPIATREEMY
jgi:PilX N-terminal